MGKEIMQCTGKMYVIDTLLFANAQEWLFLNIKIQVARWSTVSVILYLAR